LTIIAHRQVKQGWNKLRSLQVKTEGMERQIESGLEVTEMKYETTPQKITDKILELCNEINRGGIPEYINAMPIAECEAGKCFENVSRKIKTSGGQQVNGWVIWQWNNMLIEAEPYSVWQTPEGECVDITPREIGVQRILFLPDLCVEYGTGSHKSIMRPLTDSELVAELIHIAEEIDRILESYTKPEDIPVAVVGPLLKPYKERKDEILAILNRKVGRNEPCVCGSGLKYKKCCGK